MQTVADELNSRIKEERGSELGDNTEKLFRLKKTMEHDF
jgi:hypothetical protein